MLNKLKKEYKCGCLKYETGWLICETHEKIIELT